MNKNLQVITERLTTLKKELSVAAFASKCKIAQPMMDRYVKGENAPSAEKIIQICIACGCSADWLLGLTDDRGGNIGVAISHNGVRQKVAELKADAEGIAAAANELLSRIDKMEKGL